MADMKILIRVKDDLRKGIKIVVGVNSNFYPGDGDIEHELRKIVEKYPQLSEILSPIIADEGNNCVADIYFVMRNGIVSVQIKIIRSPVQFDIDVAVFDLFCDAMIGVGIFMTDGGDTWL
jgi:hypothetical protein